MADDVLDMIAMEQAGTPEPEPIVEAPAPEPRVEAPVEPTPEPSPQPEPQAQEKDQRNIPLPTYLEERERRKDAERRANEAEARYAPQVQPQQRPDPIDDPEGYAAWQDSRVDAKVTEARFNMSDIMAKQAHGAEVVEAAAVWAAERAKSDPAFAMSYMREAHPVDWIVREHQRQNFLSEVGDDRDAWFQREAEKRGYFQAAPTGAVQAVPAATPAMRPQVPPRSIASDAPASVSGGQGDAKADFMAIFDKG